ncbi:MAG: biotin/lipoyl-containing protein [Candidatus Eisenbacteria bacterium]
MEGYVKEGRRVVIYYASVNGKDAKIKIEKKNGLYVVEIDDRSYVVDRQHIESPNTLSLLVDDKCYEASVTRSDKTSLVCISGEKFDVSLKDELEYRSASPSPRHTGFESEEIRAPMPGIVVCVEVEKGQRVHAGTAAVIVEAMKMQNEISAAAGGTVKEILVQKGDIVDSRQVLVVIDRG